MTSEKIQPWKAHWVPSRRRDDIVEYGAEKGTEIIMDGAGGGAVEAPEPEEVPVPQPSTAINPFQSSYSGRIGNTFGRPEVEKTSKIHTEPQPSFFITSVAPQAQGY
jgi:hypothetical protein